MEDEGAASVEGDDDPAVVNTETEIYRDLTYTGNPMLVEYEPTCAVCFCNQAAIRKPLLRCGACRVVWYCGPQHQRQDWKAKHKSCCGTLVATGSELSTPDVVEAQLAKAASLQQKLEEAAAEDVFTQQSLLRELAHLYEYRLDTEDSKTLATGFRQRLWESWQAAEEDAFSLSCSICLEDLSQEEEGLFILPGCHHVFHKCCIEPWLATNGGCPCCRKKQPPQFGEGSSFYLRFSDGGGCYSVMGVLGSGMDATVVNMTCRVAQGVRNSLVIPIMTMAAHFGSRSIPETSEERLYFLNEFFTGSDRKYCDSLSASAAELPAKQGVFVEIPGRLAKSMVLHSLHQAQLNGCHDNIQDADTKQGFQIYLGLDFPMPQATSPTEAYQLFLRSEECKEGSAELLASPFWDAICYILLRFRGDISGDYHFKEDLQTLFTHFVTKNGADPPPALQKHAARLQWVQKVMSSAEGSYIVRRVAATARQASMFYHYKGLPQMSIVFNAITQEVGEMGVYSKFIESCILRSPLPDDPNLQSRIGAPDTGSGQPNMMWGGLMWHNWKRVKNHIRLMLSVEPPPAMIRALNEGRNIGVAPWQGSLSRALFEHEQPPHCWEDPMLYKDFLREYREWAETAGLGHDGIERLRRHEGEGLLRPWEVDALP